MGRKSERWARAVLIFLFLGLLPTAAAAGDQEFHLLVGRMADYCQKRPMRGMGLISFIANRFTPRGVGHMQIAIFENIPPVRRTSVEELASSLQSLVGPDYQPFVRDRDNRNGDVSFVYVRESGKNKFDMLVVSIDSTDAVLVKMRLDPDAMRDWVDEPVSRSHHPTRRAETD